MLVLTFAPRVLAGDSGEKKFDQFWPETDVYVNLNGSSRLYLLWSGTRTEEAGYTDGQAGVHIDWFLPPFFFKDRVSRHPDIAKNKFLTLRLGYLFGTTPKSSTNPFTEHTPTVEANSRFYFAHLLLSNRNRFDLRFINGVFTPRYRNRLKIEGTIPIKNMGLTPYAHAEAFYDWRYNAFHRFRFAAGGELEVTKRVVVESYYMRQIDSRSEPRGENIAGVALQLFFR
jgi:hypothetical protein